MRTGTPIGKNYVTLCIERIFAEEPMQAKQRNAKLCGQKHFIAYYDDLICYKYEGHMYSEIWHCAYYNIDRIEKLGKYLSKIRRKNLKDYK